MEDNKRAEERMQLAFLLPDNDLQPGIIWAPLKAQSKVSCISL